MNRKGLFSIVMSVFMGFTFGACSVGGTSTSTSTSSKTSASNSSSASVSAGQSVAALPDYDAKADELSVTIAGWLAPSDISDKQMQYIKESGISLLHTASAGSNTLSINFSSELSEESKATIEKYAANGLSLMVNAVGKDESKIDAISNVAAYSAIKGICFDEPDKSQIDKVAAHVNTFNANAGKEQSLFVNLYPSTAEKISVDFNGDYNAYLTYFCERVLNNLTVGEKWLSADSYPLTYNGKGEACLDVSWLVDVEAVALTARKYDNIKTNFFIQTMPYGGESNSGAKKGSRDRVPTYEDVRLQEYALMAFGYDMISCFCYYTPSVGVEFTEEQLAMIDRNGEPTDIYYAVQKANKEILSFDHVIKQFDWQGIFTNDAGKTANSSQGVQRTSNSSFSNLTSRISLSAIDCLNEVTTSADTLFGYFMDGEDNAGFMLVNYNDSTAQLSDTATLTFNEEYAFNKALCYVGGEKKIVDITNNSLSLTLGVGEGVFVIPYKG